MQITITVMTQFKKHKETPEVQRNCPLLPKKGIFKQEHQIGEIQQVK